MCCILPCSGQRSGWKGSIFLMTALPLSSVKIRSMYLPDQWVGNCTYCLRLRAVMALIKLQLSSALGLLT